MAVTDNAPAGQATPRQYADDAAADAIASARRAAMADRYPADALAVEWRALGELASIADDWRKLAAAALVPNVFYEPDFALAAAPVFGRDAAALLVWSNASPRELLGLFPARIETRRYGVKLPVLVGWTHPYAPLGVPLVRGEAAEPVIAAWLAHIAGDTRLPGIVLLPFLPEDAFATALGGLARRAQMPAAAFNRHGRALLAPRGDRSSYVETVLGAKRLRELRRLGRRLTESGAVLFSTATEADAVAAAAEDFFALEASGWKGEAGTAAAQHPDIRRFVAAALIGLAAEHKVAIDRVLLDGRPIAAAVTLRSGDRAWLWKIAYDEDFARWSPGVLLTIAVSETLAEDRTLVQTDSCAAPSHPLMERVWSERLALCDRLIAVRGGAPFALARRFEGWRGTAIAAARRLKHLRLKRFA
jgi:CelD/BcsL family acetyltransferase involved in cellulose biosynthesis